MEDIILSSIKIVDLQAIIKISIEEVLRSVNIAPQDAPDKIMDVHEASELLGISPATIYSKVSKRELPCMKRGKKLYFSRNELLKYLHGGRRKTAEEVDAIAQDYVSRRNQIRA